MTKAVILQKYLAPYRVPLFNEIARHPEIELILLYFGEFESRRKWTIYEDRLYSEIQCRKIGIRTGYGSNIEFPFSLLKDLCKIDPDVIVCAPDMAGITTSIYTYFKPSSCIVWSEANTITEQGISPYHEGDIPWVFQRTSLLQHIKGPE